MHTLEVTDEQLHMLHESLESFIKSFSHDQPELLHAGKELRAKLDAELATPERSGARTQSPGAAFDPEIHPRLIGAAIDAMRSIDLSDLQFRYDDGDPEGFRSGMVRPGPDLGAAYSGITCYELPPGQAVCPYHYEYGEEEWAMPLDGPLTLRDPDGEHPLAPMQLVFFPRGPQGAHLLRNDGEHAVRLLMFGEVRLPTATVYPDSDKIGVWTGNKADDLLVPRSAGVDYFHGEA